MTELDIQLLQSKHNGAIVAPAGHGKTEMITKLVSSLPGKALVLTHTNAGVNALRLRFKRKKVPDTKYVISTIANFCIRWSDAYPFTAGIDTNLDYSDEAFYKNRYLGTKSLFEHEWARRIMLETYQCVIIDEYQDCTVGQHNIFLELNQSLPIYVLGDPLQAIFDWAEPLVSWEDLEFELVNIETHPWRWESTNQALGKYLTDIRRVFEPALSGEKITLATVPQGDFVKKISPSNTALPELLSELSRYETVLYISKWPTDQCQVSRNASGFFENDEPQNLKDLYEFANKLDHSVGHGKVETLYNFICQCATNVSKELMSYKKHIDKQDYNFNRIKVHPEFGNSILSLKSIGGHHQMTAMLEYIKTRSEFKIFRRELFSELIHSIRYSQENGVTLSEAARRIRMNPVHQGIYRKSKRLSSRTVLSKGLEFECVVIDLKKSLSAKDVYVAMTRATKVIYFITSDDRIVLSIGN